MKRWLSVLLAVLMFVSALPIGVSADKFNDIVFPWGDNCSHIYDDDADSECNVCGKVREPHFYAVTDKTELSPGDTFDLTVMLENNSGLVSWMVDVDFDAYALEIIDMRQGDAFAGVGDFLFRDYPIMAMWFDFLSPNNTDEGSLFTITFLVTEYATAGEYTLDLYCSDADSFCDENGETVKVAFSDAVVTVGGCEHEYDYSCDEYCNLCGEWREAEHMYQTTADAAPPCAEHYVKDYVCMNCGDSYSKVMTPRQDHVYDDDNDRECNVCGETRDVHIHEWMEKGGVSPTCSSNGYRIIYCLGCNEMIREALPALGHVYDDAIDATCNRCGETREVEGGCQHEYDYPCAAECYLCGAVREVEHSWVLNSSWEPTCSESGLNRYSCNLCGEPYMEIVPATGEHVYDDDADPDCNNCGAVREVHVHEWMEKGGVSPTCSSNGYRIIYCLGCNEMIRESIPALGHTYDNGYDADCNRCGDARDVEPIHIYGVVDQADVERGDTFTLTVMMENNLGLAGWKVDVDFDPSALELIAQNRGDTFRKGSFSFSPLAAQSPANALWYDFISPTDTADNGVLFTFTFRVKNEAVNGALPMTLSCSDIDNIINLEGAAIPVHFDSVAVHVYGCAHQYDNACDDTCNLCGASRPTEGHVYNVTVSEATCEEGGVKVYTCVGCGDTFFETTPAFGHDYHSVVTDPTCTAPGYTVHTCLNCGGSYVGGETAPLGHAYESVVTAPTCESDGYITHTCVNCGDRYVDGERGALGHDYQVRVDTLPTCTAAGSKTYTCANCGNVYTDVIPALGHAYDSVVTAPTCGSGGYTTHTCAVCGNSYTDSLTPATGEHVFDDPRDPDCNNCGAPQDMSAHTYVSSVTVAATCGSAGVMTYTCDHCGHSYTEIIPATGIHTYDNACDGDCNGCGFTRIPAAHVYDNACDSVCNVCGFTREVGDHVYSSSVITSPTCGTAGVMAYGCIYCGYRFVAAIPATGEHRYDNDCDADCNACGTIREVGDHLYDNACDGDCNVCGATRTVAHAYRNPAAPVCANCGKALAAGTKPVIYGVADNALLTRGDTFTLYVMMDNNPGVTGWLIDVAYDEGVLNLVSQTRGDAFPGGTFSFGPMQSPTNALWTDFLSGVDYTNNGTLYILTFTVKADAAFGMTVLQVYCRDQDNITNTAWDTVVFDFANTAVVVQDHTHGYDNACDTDCNDCGFTRTVGDHVYAASVKVAPTCTAAGVRLYTCVHCGENYTESIPALGHAYNAVVTAPTCEEKGYTTHTCAHCGDCYVDGEVAAIGHAYDHDFDADCNHCGAVREIPGVYGDFSGDGRVNVRDYVMLQRYLNGWEIDLLFECADLNNDGKVNVRDLGLLQQYLNGWDVTLGK